MIDGMWWLVILLVTIVALWLLAKSRWGRARQDIGSQAAMTAGPKRPYKTTAKRLQKDSLQKTAALIKQDFPEYAARIRKHHLLITKQGKKIAMITIDKSIANGQRRLGDVPIINYHRMPSRSQLSASLQRVDVRQEDSCI